MRNQSRDSGHNAAYRVSAFARVRIQSYQLPGQNRITAKFLGYTTCNAPNLPPVALALSVTNNENTPRPISLTGSDPEQSPLTYTITSGLTNGTLSGTPPTVTNHPTTNYFGPDAFSFKVNDGTVDSRGTAPAMVLITILPVDQAPVVNAGADQLIVQPAGVTRTDRLCSIPFRVPNRRCNGTR